MRACTKCVVEGQPKVIPPLSQSRQGDMACRCLYIRKHVIGGPMAESQPAARGIEVHQVLATYINHLVRTRRSADLELLDRLMSGASGEAQAALERFRENHAFAPERVLATELYIALDDDFNPIEDAAPDHELPGDDKAQSPAYEGTLDLVLLDSVTEAEIDDWKSYYQTIDPDTFQSKFYPLLLMCLNPSIQRVKFVLEFVRYGASRSVEYTRADLPWLKELAERERERQRRLHELSTQPSAQLKASPGRHCTWCPLLLNGCPVSGTNPYGQMTAEERLKFGLWLQEAEKLNTKVLRDLMVERGPVRYRDENQNEYVADFVAVEKKFYPYQSAALVLDEWLKTHPEDRGVAKRLTVSGLSSPLKAQKRAELAEKLSEVAEIRVDTELRVGRPKENGKQEK
jgi:hypothetical protein